MAPHTIQAEVELIPLSLIDVPKKWRKVKKAAVAEIAESVKVDGLLQPIGVRPLGERFRLVLGRHRLESFRLLERDAIPAIVMDLDDVAERSATDAENLFRNPLTPAERLICLKRWNQRYVAEHPESHGKKSGTELAAGLPDDQAPTFVQHAADVTGVSRKLIELQVQIGKNLTEDELFVLSDREISQADLQALSKIQDPDQKRAAITLIGSGLDPKEAIATATLPANTTTTYVEGTSATVQAEADMTDDEWLETYCGEILSKLKYQAIFKKDAILYRQSSDLRHKFKAGMKKLLAQGKSQTVGGFYLLLARLVNTDHPKNWLHCGPCGGTGMSGDNSKCGYCNGHAYSTRTGTR